MLTKEEIPLLRGTTDVEFVDLEELAEAYVKSITRGYNSHNFVFNKNYIAINSPSPQDGFEGHHYTLVYEICDEIDFFQEELQELFLLVLGFAKEKGYNTALNDVIEKVEEIR